MQSLRVGVVNRYSQDKRRRYPLGLAIERLGSAYVPIDIREIRAFVGEDGGDRLTVPGGPRQPEVSLDDLRLDGVLWRVSEDAFHAYSDVQWLIARRYALVNNWECTRVCASKWRSSVVLSAAGIGVVPTMLLSPGMKVPAFPGVETVIKPSVSARGRGVRVAEAGTDPGITESYVAQPLIGGPAEDQVRALVCGPGSVLAMIRRPAGPDQPGLMRVNNIEAGAVPAPTGDESVRDIALAAANCLGGDLLGVDLVRRDGKWEVLEVNASPGLDGVAQVAAVDCYRLAAEAVLSRLRQRRAADAEVSPAR